MITPACWATPSGAQQASRVVVIRTTALRTEGEIRE